MPRHHHGTCGTPMLWATGSAEARFTSRPEWSSAGESMWMRLSKFSLCNQLTLHELSCLVLLPSNEISTRGADLRRADRFDQERLSDLLEASPAAVAAGFCCSKPTPGWVAASTELRYCRECLQQGFHAAWFQWSFISRCPLHKRALRLGCPSCAMPIKYALQSEMAEHPLACAYCAQRWVPALHLPAGRCTPISGRPARILRRWQACVGESHARLSKPLRRQHDPLTGQFVTARRSHAASVRSTVHVRISNRLYDTPPPTILELLERRPPPALVAFRPNPGPSEPCDPCFEQTSWPHFRQRFLQFERTLQQTQDTLFGNALRNIDERVWTTLCRQQFVIATDTLSADTAAAIGWHLSWLGFVRACGRIDLLSTPALGLTGWLAHSPDRPRAIAYAVWTDQLTAWLQDDLTTSAWVWRHIVLFMRKHKYYLLHPALARPAELAAYRTIRSRQHDTASAPLHSSPRTLKLDAAMSTRSDYFTSIRDYFID